MAQAVGAATEGREIQEDLTLPRGATNVLGAMGRSDVNVLGGDVSFLGFLAILLLRCSPLAMMHPRWSSRIGKTSMVRHKAGHARGLLG